MSGQTSWSISALLLAALSAACPPATRKTHRPAVAPGSYTYKRVYKNGEKYAYTLQTETFINGRPTSTLKAEALLRSSTAGIPHDVVTWDSLVRSAPGRPDKDLSGEALKVAAYKVSMDPRSPPKIPELDVSAMTGPITDLMAFMVSAHPAGGSTRVRKPGDQYKNPKRLIGKWSNKTSIPLGQDCLHVGLTLTRLTPTRAAYKAVYTPPRTACLKYAAPFMGIPIAKSGPPNNIQQIRKVSDDRRTVMYGLERFTVRVSVDLADGKIVSGTMNNLLHVRIRGGCAADLSKCSSTLVLRIQRKLTLTLKGGK